jgi:LacI family transcriptional regulator
LPTSEDVAKLAQVSRATVSNVLTGARFVSPELVESVENAIRQLNYHPHGIARSLAARKTLTIGLIVPRIASPFYPPIVSAVEKALAREGYSIILGDSNENATKEEKIMRVLIEKRVDGLLWVPSSEYNVEFIRSIDQSGIPVVVIDRRLTNSEFDMVVSDNKGAGKLATEYLLGHGYRRISILTFSQKLAPARERLEGYLEAYENAGAQVDKNLICVVGNPELKNARMKLNRILHNRGKPEAIFACSDLLSLSAILEIKRTGYRIPEDIAVVGFDDSPWGALLDPPLTVITQDTQNMGTVAAQILLKRLKNKGHQKAELVELPVTLVKRKSCNESNVVY